MTTRARDPLFIPNLQTQPRIATTTTTILAQPTLHCAHKTKKVPPLVLFASYPLKPRMTTCRRAKPLAQVSALHGRTPIMDAATQPARLECSHNLCYWIVYILWVYFPGLADCDEKAAAYTTHGTPGSLPWRQWRDVYIGEIACRGWDLFSSPTNLLLTLSVGLNLCTTTILLAVLVHPPSIYLTLASFTPYDLKSSVSALSRFVL